MPPNPAPDRLRYLRLDQARGWAVVMMVAFHACYDLNWLGFLQLNLLTNPFWLIWRALIVGSFVWVSGATLQLSHQPKRAFLGRREIQLLVAALLVSAVSAWLFGSRWIYFGVLHFFLLATLITRPLLSHPVRLGILGALLWLLGSTLGFDFMNPRTLNWIGLAAQKPFTEDYAPLLPWLGVFWVGAWWASTKPAWLMTPAGENQKGILSWIGQRALPIYLLHQPLLLAGLEALRWGFNR
jgi:uncharacterized membrane protein